MLLQQENLSINFKFTVREKVVSAALENEMWCELCDTDLPASVCSGTLCHILIKYFNEVPELPIQHHKDEPNLPFIKINIRAP